MQWCCQALKHHATHHCTNHKTVWDCDTTFFFDEEGKYIGIPVRDGGRSFIVIKFCPFCGAKIKFPRKPKQCVSNA